MSSKSSRCIVNSASYHIQRCFLQPCGTLDKTDSFPVASSAGWMIGCSVFVFWILFLAFQKVTLLPLHSCLHPLYYNSLWTLKRCLLVHYFSYHQLSSQFLYSLKHGFPWCQGSKHSKQNSKEQYAHKPWLEDSSSSKTTAMVHLGQMSTSVTPKSSKVLTRNSFSYCLNVSSSSIPCRISTEIAVLQPGYRHLMFNRVL